MQSPSQIFKQCDYIVSINRILVLKNMLREVDAEAKKIRLASGVGKCSFSFSPLPDLQGTRQAFASPLVLTSDWPHTPWALELKHASSTLHRSYQTKDSLCFLLQSVCVGSTSHPPGSREKRSHTVFLILPRVRVAGNQD